MGTSGRNCSPSTRSRESFSEAEKLVDGNGKERSGKLFFVSSSSTTSTVSTTTLCFTTDAAGAALGTCTKKRRRRSIEEANLQTDEQIYSTPVRRQIEEEENHEPQLDSGVRDNSMDREGRFLLYWMTTTSTSTTTLSNLICTPNGFTISLCG